MKGKEKRESILGDQGGVGVEVGRDSGT